MKSIFDSPENAKAAFQDMEKLLGHFFADDMKCDYLNDKSPSSIPSKSLTYRFSGNRWSTFWQFIRCAIEIVFTGKTNLTIKKV